MCFFPLIQFLSTLSLKKQSIAKQQVYALTASDVSALNSSLFFDWEEMPNDSSLLTRLSHFPVLLLFQQEAWTMLFSILLHDWKQGW